MLKVQITEIRSDEDLFLWFRFVFRFRVGTIPGVGIAST